ncbi:metalloreductase STEAP4-like isoform X2 [Mercenaria mercenaria]|uniref:metalloreductase STEAP4-like isoform X2 n=1 Tax=Mercenaria mercenaria TaxID=6596 RepID=UPI00234F815D|nr:metalloreductase STEAP4-like isoform X2 [Mercenaria mercenaria]
MEIKDITMNEQRQSVGILGTGDFARALAKRLYFSGYDVIIGSRRPEENLLSAIDECLCNMSLVSIEECIESVSVIFLAVHAENFKDLLQEYTEHFDGKIVVDVSNRDKASDTYSNAEYLQTLIPRASVVKAFNVISAYAMENNYNTSSRQVFIAGNNDLARGAVSNIARAMNFTPVDFGSLIAARRIEKHPLLLFPGWSGPCWFTITVFIIWLLYLVFIYYIEQTVYEWEQIFVKVLNKAICMTGITVLSVTYLASSFAAIIQLYNGTKHIRFSRWLDKWLKNRKQLGLISFMLIAIHAIMSTLIMSPTYLRSWYHSTKIVIPHNMSEAYEFQNINWMTWKGEAACMTGIFSFTLLCFVCVSTLPSVTDTLNWREWRFVQSKLGHLALFLAVVHVLVMGIPGWAKTPKKVYKSITFLSSFLPWITILLKLFFSIPCVDRYITKIRKGWERKDARCKATCVRSKNHSYAIVNCSQTTGKVGDNCLCPCDVVDMTTFDKTNCVYSETKNT